MLLFRRRRHYGQQRYNLHMLELGVITKLKLWYNYLSNIIFKLNVARDGRRFGRAVIVLSPRLGAGPVLYLRM